MTSGAPIAAVLVDALGTLVELEPPGPALQAGLAATGFECDAEAADRATGAEIAYYLAHHLEGRDPEGLADLRRRCAEVVAREVGHPDPGAVLGPMLAAFRFRPFDDAAPFLAWSRECGLRVVIASNWDCSLGEAMVRAGLGGLVHGFASSAVCGASKPDPAVFRHALALAGCPPSRVVHVGDTPAGDVAGARAASIEPLLLDRAGALAGQADGARVVSSLTEVPALLDGRLPASRAA